MVHSSFFQDPLLDQIFMTNPEIIEKIISFAELKKTETVLEIGAGKGDLTEAIAGRCRKVIAIEIDERLRGLLEERFRGKNVRIVWGNALNILKTGRLHYDKIVANPPYAICEPLIKALFGQRFSSAVLTLPWRFVERITSNPEEPRFSKLSVFTRAFFRTEILLRVERDAWHPRPDTASFVVRLTPKKPAGMAELVLREMALQEDKKLRNALREALMKHMKKTKRQASGALERLGLPSRLLDRKISQFSCDDVMKVAGRFANEKKV